LGLSRVDFLDVANVSCRTAPVILGRVYESSSPYIRDV